MRWGKKAPSKMAPSQIGKTKSKVTCTKADNYEVFSCTLNIFPFFKDSMYSSFMIISTH